jgi:RNA polymerase sigma factor (sigma-70 family)
MEGRRRRAGTVTLVHESDERLVALARMGDEQALAVIVARYHAPLLRYCRRLVPAGRAEDVLQQALLNACVAIRAGGPRGALRPWMYRVAHNAAIDALRDSQASHERLDEDLDRTESLEDAVERREYLRSLLRGISGLPFRQRRAIVMRVQGHGHDEIAADLDVSGDAARQLLRRGRARLREVAVVMGPIELVRAAFGAAAAHVPCLGGSAMAKVGAGLAAAGVLAVAQTQNHGRPVVHTAGSGAVVHHAAPHAAPRSDAPRSVAAIQHREDRAGITRRAVGNAAERGSGRVVPTAPRPTADAPVARKVAVRLPAAGLDYAPPSPAAVGPQPEAPSDPSQAPPAVAAVAPVTGSEPEAPPASQESPAADTEDDPPAELLDDGDDAGDERPADDDG